MVQDICSPLERSSTLFLPHHGGETFEISYRLRAPPERIMDFSANVNPLGAPFRSKEAIRKCLDYVSIYPDKTCSKLKQSISTYLGGIPPARILVGNGSTELIHLFARANLDEGDEAIIPQPTFSEYQFAVSLAGAATLQVPLAAGFRIDPRDLISHITDRTRVVFLCNPNNPTSTIVPRENLLAIVAECAGRGVMVLIDECFVELTDGGEKLSMINLTGKYRNLIVLRSLTKSFGLAGLRIGYAVGHESVVGTLEREKVTWSVNTIAQIAAAEALRDRDYLHRSRTLIKRERQFLSRSLMELGFKVTLPKANFVLSELPDGLDGRELKGKLLDSRIIIRECSGFPGLGPRFIRVAVLDRARNRRLLNALRTILKD